MVISAMLGWKNPSVFAPLLDQLHGQLAGYSPTP